MTAPAVDAELGATSAGRVRRGAVQTLELARRSLIAEWRNPFGAASGLVFPLVIAAVYSAQFDRATGLEGFPEVDSFLDFLLPASILQAVAFGATAAGGEMALDIQDGFFDRLLAAPTSRVSILLGKLGGAAVVAGLKAIVLLAVFLVFGASVASGVAGALLVVLVAVLLVLFLGGMGLVLAIRTGSQEAVDSTFPLIFVTLFISSAFFPTNLMKGWYRQVAEANPITWMIDPLRRLVIDGFSWTDALQAVAVPGLGAVATIGLALVALRRRLAAS